ncbi:MAG: type II toxin-antitoxin system RelE/ParE family toxin [Nitrospirota bacterium]|nr:type II toxin-antitoxin system RelE/ParE family toxin [Nitrospirota bacterium]
MNKEPLKPLIWVGDSRKRLKEFPREAQRTVGRALDFAQRGGMHPSAKPFKGVGTGVLEIIARYDTDTYRAVYAVKVGDVVYVLHAFQKKSKSGIKTPKGETDLIKKRFKRAKEIENERE